MINQPANRPIIFHVINSLSMGGAELLLSNSLRMLSGFEHIVFYLHEPVEFRQQFEEQGIKVVSLNYTSWRCMPLSVLKLNKLIKKTKPILVHSHLFHSTICARLATPASVPLVSTIHSVYSKDAFEKNIKSLWAVRFTLKKRHSLIAVSDHVLADYLAHVPFKGKRFVLHNFLPDTAFKKTTHQNLTCKIKLVAVGNLKDAKNYFYLLEIFKQLKDIDVSLDIFGMGSQEEALEDYIKKNELEVRLRGMQDDIPSILEQYDYFIQASSHEGFGISVIEAMAAGIHVLLSDIPVFREITNGLATFFPLNNAAKAAAIIKETVLSKKSVTNTEQAYQFVLNNYSANYYRDKLLNIYSQVTQKNLS